MNDHKQIFLEWISENPKLILDDELPAIEELKAEPTSEFNRRCHLSPQERIDAKQAEIHLRNESEPAKHGVGRVLKPLRKCEKCGVESRHLMSASPGPLCPNCYDG